MSVAVLARCGRSFRLAGRLLPGNTLHDAAALYAFCRVADDDPSGYARTAFPLEGWKIIRLPAIAEHDEEHQRYS